MSFRCDSRSTQTAVWRRMAAVLWIILLQGLLFADIGSAATWNPLSAAEFTNALNNSQLGDTIVLQAGTTYTGTFTLPNKTTGTGIITIQSSALASLPPTGTRVAPSNASSMPKIQAPFGGQPAIATAAAAHHFKLSGLEIIGAASGDTFQIVALGATGAAQTSLSQVPNNITVERCIVRANSATQAIQRGIGLNSASTDILDSRIEGCKWLGADSQAIAGWNGPGPYNIINCYLEGAGENVMFGGADASILNLIPSDITIKRNHFFKPFTWHFRDPSYAGLHWTVKNIFELKNARRVTVDGNILENNWGDAQIGFAILFTVRNQNGNSPWSAVEDVLFTNNIIRHSAGGVQCLGTDNLNPSQLAQRVTTRNNLFYDIGGTQFGPNGRFFQLTRQCTDFTIDHNTAFHTNHVIVADGPPSPGLVYTNNLHPHNEFGVFGDAKGTGNVAIDFYFPGAVFTKNVLMGGPASLYSNYPGNFFPSSWTGVLNNQAGGDFANGDWNVVSGSAYDNTGTDGKDIGADIPAILTATAGCISGVWGSQPPPPPPPPAPVAAYEGFDYIIGGLTGNNGGTGWGGAWTTGQGNGSIVAGSMTYSDLTVTGNKGQAQNSRNFRQLASPIALSASNPELWIAFIAKAGSTGSGLAGISLFNGGEGSNQEIALLGKGANKPNWGFGSNPQSTIPATTQALLVYQFTWQSSSQVNAKMWINPSLGAVPTSTPDASQTFPSISFDRIRMGTTQKQPANFDELRIGATFASVTPTTPTTPVEVIVDNLDAVVTGTWTPSTWTGGGEFFGTNYFHDGNAGKGTKTCRWIPTLPSSGTYQVYARWTSAGDRATNAPYTIQHAGGLANVAMNQQSQGGTWVLLGSWDFSAGASGYVQLDNAGTSGFVIADAVRFLKP